MIHAEAADAMSNDWSNQQRTYLPIYYASIVNIMAAATQMH